MEPIAWYWPTAASGPVPCKWGGWVYFGSCIGEKYIIVSLLGVE